jgi:hypothetical protein
LRRRVASSRPSRCGIDTIRGADIFKSCSAVAECSSILAEKKEHGGVARGEGTLQVPIGFPR